MLLFAKVQKPLPPTSPKLLRDTCHGEVWGKSATWHGEVADMDHVMGKVTEKFRGYKPSRRVEIVWKIPVTSRQQARLSTRNEKIGDVRDKTRGSRRRRGQITRDITVFFLTSRRSRGSRHNGIWALCSNLAWLCQLYFQSL